MLLPAWEKNDKRANWLIISFSVIVFLIVASLGRIKPVKPDFDGHIFAMANAIINSLVAVLLLAALIAVKAKRYLAHKRIMITAMLLSILFLISYISHHVLEGETPFGGGGTEKTIYYIILFTHIPLAGIILPFILYSAYRAMIGEYERHKKLVRITWPIWFYVAVTGVVVYLMISPYYT